MAKGFKTGGRIAGTKNKATNLLYAGIASTGLAPIDYLLKVMRNSKIDIEIRTKAALYALPYCHSKLRPIEMNSNYEKENEEEPFDLMKTAREMASLLESSGKS